MESDSTSGTTKDSCIRVQAMHRTDSDGDALKQEYRVIIIIILNFRAHYYYFLLLIYLLFT